MPKGWVFEVSTHDGSQFRKLGEVVFTRTFYEKFLGSIEELSKRTRFSPAKLAEILANKSWEANPVIVHQIKPTGRSEYLLHLLRYHEMREGEDSQPVRGEYGVVRDDRIPG